MKSTPFFPQVHFSAAMNANQAGNTPLAKAHAAAVSAALSAAAVYGEWAPLAPLMRSGMLDACAHFLSSPEFRSQACEVLRHVAHRRRGDTVNSAIASGAAGVAGGKGLADHAPTFAAPPSTGRQYGNDYLVSQSTRGPTPDYDGTTAKDHFNKTPSDGGDNIFTIVGAEDCAWATGDKRCR